MNYYNEFDPKAAAWLRELIKEGIIPNGHVDERSIADVAPAELAGFTQCHFFAGIGGWSEALRLAGWPSDKPVWTGSCPCQPFSSAGKQLGTADSRHLWPEFARLIKGCNPPVVFGEQVASAAGREWLAGVFADLEAMGYSRAGADLCAAGVGAPQRRQRLYWVASAMCGRQRKQSEQHGAQELNTPDWSSHRRYANGCDCPAWLGNSNESGSQGRSFDRNRSSERTPWETSVGVLGNDGKWRRVEPGIPPVAARLPFRVALIRGSGNAIVPQVAAEFIQAFLET